MLALANGEFVHGHDVVPRGHPGDGRVEVQVYAVRPGQRILLRERLATGSHLPHPAIQQAVARVVDVELPDGDWPLEVDGRQGAAPVAGVHVEVVAEAFALVV